MKRILPLLMILGSTGCHQGELWDNPAKILLTETPPASGSHCESSALLNALLYQGYEFTEAQIVGGGAAMGFLYQKGSFPFLGGRSLTMKEYFLESAGIQWQSGDNGSRESAWAGARKRLEQDTPVVLRVDMRYLPYLYGGKYGSRYTSFGWHVITLFGVDPDKGLAYVSDTAFTGMQQIRLKDLEKARSSHTKVLPPDRKYYWVEKAPDGSKTDWQRMLDRSVGEILRNYRYVSDNEKELAGLQGQEDWPGVIRQMQEDTPRFLLPSVLVMLHGWIEEYGTGGAAFRVLTRDYFVDMAEKTGDPRLTELIPLMDASIDQWRRVSNSFRSAGEAMEQERDKNRRQEWLNQSAEEAEILYNREKAVYDYLNTHWEE